MLGWFPIQTLASAIFLLIALIIQYRTIRLNRERREIERLVDFYFERQLGVRVFNHPTPPTAERPALEYLEPPSYVRSGSVWRLPVEEQLTRHAYAEARKEWTAFEKNADYTWTPFVAAKPPSSYGGLKVAVERQGFVCIGGADVAITSQEPGMLGQLREIQKQIVDLRTLARPPEDNKTIDCW